MAGGNKKKKKPAANPARGFATTSIASKVKPEKTPEASNETSEDTSTVATTTPATSEDVSVPDRPVQAKERELHELSPEELEAQLEQSELQQLVEQQGPKARKEAARQSSRLQTDRRVLRTQADLLTVKDWLPDELMEQIIDLTLEEHRATPSSDSKVDSLRKVSDDVALLRVWQLYIVLKQIDIPEERITQALEYILCQPPTETSTSAIWGLNEVLEWLGLNCDAGELLDYEASKPKTQASLADNSDAGKSTFCFNPARFSNDSDLSVKQIEDEFTDPKVSNASPAKKQRDHSVQPNQNEHSTIPEDDIVVSDVESDLEPDDMLDVYLRSKARLFDRNPALVDEADSAKRGSKQKGSQAKTSARPSRGESKLQQRLRKIESDVLFDKQMADYRWKDQKIDLQRQRAERMRLDIGEKAPQRSAVTREEDDNPFSTDVMDEAEELGRKMLEEASLEDDSDVLGGMFDVPAESESSTSQQAQGDNPPGLVTRNFGKVPGISPRRVLEDACRSRDSRVKIRFKQISSTTYNCRHLVSILWSKEQALLEPEYHFMAGFRIQNIERATSVEMQTVAASEVAQSEGYVATAALFQLFSASPKEEKTALRLPPAYRDLWQEFITAKKDQLETQDRATVKKLRQLITDQQEKEDDEDVVLTAGFKNRSKIASGMGTPNGQSEVNEPSMAVELDELKTLWAQKSSTPNYQQMLVGRKELPMYHYRETGLDIVRNNQVTILCGETGCGKSTQMPAFILEDELSHGRKCKVYCTEPRRISAISLAQRVSEELGEGKNAVGTGRSLVGYAIRLESHTSASTRLVYATVGIVLRMLESEKGLSEVTHLVIDEVHERSIDTDFLLIILKSLLVRRPDLKVVLMSATVDAQRFSSYLGNAPIVQVPGRTFPVQGLFLEDAIEITGYTNEDSNQNGAAADDDDDDIDPESKTSGSTQGLVGYSPKTVRTLANYDEYKINYNLILKLLENVAYNQQFQQFSNAILIFLPGIAEIRQLNDILTSVPSFSQGWLVYPLHSTFSSEEQQAAFKVPPPGMRKIVLATNIAETGITIPDVTCVIDTGTHKEMRFDERRQMSRLIQAFVSRANAKQRRGRAGRVQEGICFHLFTKHRHDELMSEAQTPEMLRLSLQDLVMRVKICKLGDIEHALSAALDPPSLKNIRRAIDALVEVDALTAGEELTPLGQQLAKLPLDAQLGKLILLGAVFGCLDFALTTAAIASSKSPFVAPLNQKKQADTVRLAYKRGDSDLLTAYNAYDVWRKTCNTPGSSEFQFCKRNFLSQQNLMNIEELKSQLLTSLADAGFVSLSAEDRTALSRVRQSNRNRTFVPIMSASNTAEANDLLINSVAAWSFYPKILTRDGKGWRNIGNNQSISLHPTSVNKLSQTPTFEATKFLSFYSIMQSSSRFTNAQETSPIEAMALVLLAGDAVFHLYAGVIIIDGNRLRLKVRDWRTMIVLKTMRTRMKEIMARAFKSPGREIGQKQKAWFNIFLAMFDKVNAAKTEKAR
ncbi:hypothetical protein MBLNU457_2291t1 [Dothideomycetes sp. NU457]